MSASCMCWINPDKIECVRGSALPQTTRRLPILTLPPPNLTVTVQHQQGYLLEQPKAHAAATLVLLGVGVVSLSLGVGKGLGAALAL